MIAAAQVSVGTTAVSLATASNVGRPVLIRNAGTASVFLGPQAVIAGTGFELTAGGSVSVDLAGGESIYAIAQSTQRVDVLQGSA